MKRGAHLATSPRRRREKGSTLLESAVLLLTFLVMVLGIMDWGRMMLANNFISYGAREGARYAATHGNSATHPASTSDISTLVKNEAVGLDTSKITVTTTWTPSGNNSPGSTVNVVVQYSFTAIAPYMPGNMTLKSSSTMTVLH